MGWNPHLIRNLKLNRAVNKLFDAFEPLTEENADMKSIFASKTFWFNVLSAGAQIFQLIPLKPQTTAGIVGVINIALRYVTDQPVSLLGDK